MALPTNTAIWERCEIIQRDVVGQLPALNQGGSPKLGTFCRLNNGEYWAAVVDDTSPQYLLKWEQVGGGGAQKPDQRFTVGKATYDLIANPATFTSISAGLAAAAAGTGTTLGAASVTSQRFVWIMPDEYTEAQPLALQPYVHLEGAGGASQSAVLIGSATYSAGSGYLVLRNLRFSGSTITVTPTNGAALTIIFDNCTFEDAKWSLATPGGDQITRVTVVFNGCTGNFDSMGSVVGAGDSLTHYFDGLPSTGQGNFAALRGISFDSTPIYTGAGLSTVSILGGQRLLANGAGGPILRFEGASGGSVTTEDCLLFTGNIQASVFGSFSVGPVEWVCRSGTKLGTTPRSYWSTTGPASFVGGQVEILDSTINDASAPLDPVAGGTVTATPYPSNRQRYVEEFSFAVPASQSGGGGPYADAAGAIAAMTVNALVSTNAYADEYRIIPSYANLYGDPVDPNSANFATTFRFASFQLKAPTLLEDGRPIVVKNAANPASNTAGPIALRLPNGAAGTVEYKVSDASINGTFDTTNYIILQPGQAVILDVDRQGANDPSYVVISVVDALPGTPPAPDQRFTVGKVAYALNGPGVNTWLTPEDGIAAAQAGTGTGLGVASAVSPRVVWIMPDTYTGPQGVVSLLPNVHLLGAAGHSGAVILDSYALDFSAAGTISIRGITFRNCSISAHPTSDTVLEFVECEFVDCTWATTNDDNPVTTYRFVRCNGNFTSHVDTLSANATISKQFEGGDSTYGSTATVAPTSYGPSLNFGAVMQVAGVGGLAFITISGGQRMFPPNNSSLLLVTGDANVEVGTRDCFIQTSTLASVLSGTTTGFVNWTSGPGTVVYEAPRSYFDVTGSATFTGNEVCVNGSTAFPNGGSPLDPVSGGTVDSTQNHPSNRQRCSQKFDFNVPAARATVANQTVNNAVATNAYADEYRIKTTYQPGFVLQPNSAVPATFQYASFVLIDPSLFEDGREVVLVNVSDVTANGSSVALRLPNGSSSRIGYKQADISVNTTFDSTNFIILAAGDHVRLSVDRSDPATARYWVNG